MSTILALSYLRKSQKCLPSVSKLSKLFIYQKNILPAAQSLTTKPKINTPNPDNTNNGEWRTIYHLPMIRLASAFNRVKIPYAILNGLVLPISFALEQSSLLSPPTASIVTAVGLTSCISLAICSLVLRNLIGIIYINDNNDKLKLAYIDYWGKRNDVCVELDDVIPESEKMKTSKLDFYRSICFYSNDKVKYKLLQRFGFIEERETFLAIFGE